MVVLRARACHQLPMRPWSLWPLQEDPLHDVRGNPNPKPIPKQTNNNSHIQTQTLPESQSQAPEPYQVLTYTDPTARYKPGDDSLGLLENYMPITHRADMAISDWSGAYSDCSCHSSLYPGRMHHKLMFIILCVCFVFPPTSSHPQGYPLTAHERIAGVRSGALVDLDIGHFWNSLYFRTCSNQHNQPQPTARTVWGPRMAQ